MTLRTIQRLLIVGYPGETHVGAHLHEAAKQLRLQSALLDAGTAVGSSRLLTRMNWRFRQRRPTYLSTFSNTVIRRCQELRPDLVIVTGITPPNAAALHAIRTMGIPCVNYLTDDPWNSAHFSHWFFEALEHYTHIFSPRSSNLADLAQIGLEASYLPFAYNPNVHFPELPPTDIADRFVCDVLFYGGADQDRVSYIEALIRSKMNVHLYGQYWERFPLTRNAAKGMADAKTLRWAVSSAKITLCLVRKANRDGHVMRTYEAPAMGACMLAEETEEHKVILGEESKGSVYFNSIGDMIDKVKWLVHDEPQRTNLTQKMRQKILGGSNTYIHRLNTMLEYVQKYVST